MNNDWCNENRVLRYQFAVRIGLFFAIFGVAFPVAAQNRYRPYQPVSQQSSTSESQVTQQPTPQFPSSVNQDSPVNPTKNLEQPVFIADRVMTSSPTLDYSRQNTEQINQPAQLDSLTTNASPPIDYTKFEGGTLIAVVGKEPILLGDIIDVRKVPAQQKEHPSFEAMLRKSLTEKILKKSLAQKFFNDQLVGKPVKERKEAEGKMKTKVTQVFYDEMLPSIMKDQKCESLDEFCALIEKQGLTLQGLKENYAESILAQQCIRENVPNKPPVLLEEMSLYYDEHLADFQQKAKVRFQILTALFSKYPTREEAEKAIAEMGDEVFFGKPFETVAKSKSSGMNAETGGYVDWTNQGALKSKELNDVLFSIDLNGLSRIVEDTNGYHIVRVLERQEARLITFAEAQSEIKKKLIESKKEKLHKEFLEKVKQETAVWSRWPEDYPNAKPLSELEW
ncbi:MAG: peptidylprolyl isomerase [Pirellula sp.]